MSIAIVLESVRDFLRTRLSLDPDQCDIEPEGMPPSVARKMFIGIDERDTRSSARERFEEEYAIDVWVCREAAVYPEAKKGSARLKQDLYLTNLRTLENLSRDVARVLHENYDFLNATNTLAGVPDAETGDLYNCPLFYEGMDKTEIAFGENSKEWHRRRVRFGGMVRRQTLTKFK